MIKKLKAYLEKHTSSTPVGGKSHDETRVTTCGGRWWPRRDDIPSRVAPHETSRHLDWREVTSCQLVWREDTCRFVGRRRRGRIIRPRISNNPANNPAFPETRVVEDLADFPQAGLSGPGFQIIRPFQRPASWRTYSIFG